MLSASIDDPLGGGDGDDDVARIAREMEAKYGSGSSYGKSNVKDVDRGVGYDNNDSFIDDTDAYDEFIPDEYIPDRGGFYVNSGLLEFKKIPNFERPGDENRMPKARKRALSTSSESEAEDENKKSATSDAAVVIKKKSVNKEKKAKSSVTASSSSDEQGKAAKKAKKTKDAESLPPIKEQEVKEKEKKIPPAPPATADPEIKKETTVKDMLRIKRDNMRKMEQVKEGVPVITIDADDASESNSLGDSNDSPNETTNTTAAPTTSKSNGQTTPELSLPSNFSPELCLSITNLRDYVKKTASLNTNFYDNYVKEQLIKIDDLGKLHDTSTQVQVYKQLEIFIPSSKKAILSKVNRFRIQHAESKLKSQIKKLKSAINRTLPDLVKKYDEDLKDYEGKKNLGHINPFEMKAPRRKFRWDDNLRQTLSDTVQLIIELHKVSKSKKDPIDEFKNTYLRSIVLPLWPDEWMKFDDLRRELERKERGASQNVPQPHNGKFSSPPQKTENSVVHEKSPSPSLSQKQQQISVIKKSSDHSISSIMSSPSPPPPPPSSSASSSVQSHPVNVAQLKAKVIQLSEPKTPEKRHRLSDGSDSDCAIIESPRSLAASVPIKTPDTHHYVSNNKQQQNDVKKAREEAEDYSNLINSFSLLTVSNFEFNFKQTFMI